MSNPYCDLITSQHQQPRFMAVVAALTQPLLDAQAALEQMRRGFDLDNAEGVQLDQTGAWIGRTRYLRTPLTDVFFAFDTPGVGWGEGSWRGPYDDADKMMAMADDAYRLLLKAKVAANGWDGTLEGAYEIWEAAFADTGCTILIQDNQDMSIIVGLAGTPPSAVLEQLLLQGYIPLKPAGVRVQYYAIPPVGGDGSIFAWDCDSAALNGWGRGAWPRIIKEETSYAD